MTSKKPLTVTEMARLGGLARARKLSPEEQSRIGKKAVAAREAKRAQALTAQERKKIARKSGIASGKAKGKQK